MKMKKHTRHPLFTIEHDGFGILLSHLLSEEQTDIVLADLEQSILERLPSTHTSVVAIGPFAVICRTCFDGQSAHADPRAYDPNFLKQF
jgi:hypothetical protein